MNMSKKRALLNVVILLTTGFAILFFTVGTVGAATCGGNTTAVTRAPDSIGGTGYEDAQQITFSADCTPTDADMWLHTSTVSGNVAYKIYTDSGSGPGTLLFTSGGFAASTITVLSGGQAYNDTFSGATCLTAGTYYLSVLRTSGSGGQVLVHGSNGGGNFYYGATGGWTLDYGDGPLYADINGTVASCSGGGGGGGTTTIATTITNITRIDLSTIELIATIQAAAVFVYFFMRIVGALWGRRRVHKKT